ncbi:MAG TPA: amidase [Chloroflexia bacterium]|nr:amidase [Chloroflexia bacterium]
MTTVLSGLTELPAVELAEKISRGEVSAVEAVEAHIEQIERVNPKINAVVYKRYNQARKEARHADAQRARGEKLGVLHGVPVTIKECLDLAESPSTFGLPSRAKMLAKQDDPYVARLRAEGAIVLGKTNVAQLLIFVETENPLYGRTNNPWNLERSAGGSSGGQAAIIAAGGSPLGLGTDLGGSIRFPSTSCGIVGFKPTTGRCPDQGRFSLPIGQQAIFSQVGVMGRRVADVTTGLTVINGGSNPAVEPARPLGDPSQVDLSGLRVAFYSDDGTLKPAPAVRRAVVEAAQILQGLGAQIFEWQPPRVDRAVDLFYGIMTADGGAGLRQRLGKNKADPRVAQLLSLGKFPRPVFKMLLGLLKAGGQESMVKVIRNFGYKDTDHYWQLLEEQLDYRESFEVAMNEAEGGPIDLILCPASPLPAVTHGSTKDLGTLGGYTVLWNVLGYPTGILPFTRVRQEEEVGRVLSKDKVEQAALQVEKGSAGLPVGVQIVARPWREHTALAAMQAIEKVASHRPDYPGIARV